MTEYATDPETIQEYMSARDRCANWVNVHGQGLSFLSPSSPPSMLSDEDAPSYGPSVSDASSSHSLPPRMLLRYEDGRPDVPISQRHDRAHPPHSSSRHSQSRAGSHPAPEISGARHAQSLSYASGSRYAPTARHLIDPPRSPENIRVLPSRQPDEAQRPASHSRVPVPPVQTIFPQNQPSIHDRAPGPLADPLHTSNRTVFTPTSRHRASSSQPIPVIASPDNLSSPTHSHPAPGGSRFYEQPGMAPSVGPSGLPYHYSPPAIVYAPSGRHGRSNYQPPAIVYSPSSHGHRRAPAPGIAYSRSDPLPHPTQYSPQHNAGGTPFPSTHGSTSHRERPRAQSTTEHTQSRGRRSNPAPRDRMRTRSPTPSLSQSDTSSDTSGSTYYVLPSPGQKVQIIVPNSASVYTAKPSTRSPRTPSSPSSAGTGSPKKPFFARLFSRGSGSVDSRGSSSGQGKRLVRRHTVVGGTHLPSQSAR
ncbi:hypothetical protein C8Q80DRAFT_350737 [Daedaleopsis nitida]|nr:hypothetical protein C8Q80DRAFT_350737 [Daedaleopsis nitida]